MILETNGPLIAEKVTSHSLDADAPLSEQVMQLYFVLVCVWEAIEPNATYFMKATA